MINYSREKLIKCAKVIRGIKNTGVIILLLFVIISLLNSR